MYYTIIVTLNVAVMYKTMFLYVEQNRWQQFGHTYNTIEAIRPYRRDSIVAEQCHNFGKRQRSCNNT